MSAQLPLGETEREFLEWAADTLRELNPSNYTHEDACSISAASVVVVLAIARRLKALDPAPAWQPIETAPEDELVLVAATGGWVDTAHWTDEGDGPVWVWAGAFGADGKYMHPDIKPTHWMPLPKHPEAA